MSLESTHAVFEPGRSLVEPQKGEEAGLGLVVLIHERAGWPMGVEAP